jgi:hypothetical protein
VKALEEQMKVLPQAIYDILVQFDEQLLQSTARPEDKVGGRPGGRSQK